jgi:PTH1 family peptidyl-tRNA hydrolase
MAILIFGLGNIGEKYEGTRHNIGFMVVDEVARKKNLNFTSGHKVQVAKFQASGKTVYLLKPTTFMNLSGEAVLHWINQTRTEIEDILVITDDLSLPFSTIRIRAKGSAGGHNGLTDIENRLKRQDYARMRMGIGSDFPKGQQVSYVLGKFPEADADALSAWVDKAAEAVLCFISRGLAATMNQFNG